MCNVCALNIPQKDVSMEDNRAILTSYQTSTEEGHSYPEVAAQADNSEPTYPSKEEGNPVYEHLPDRKEGRYERRMSPTGAPAGKRLEGQSTIYGDHGLPPKTKVTYKDGRSTGGRLQPETSRRRASGVVACGAAVLFVGLAFLLSIAALVLFVFLYLGILPLPGVPGASLDIGSLRANVSVLEKRVMELQSSASTTVAPTVEPVAPTVEPEMAVFEDIRVVNFSECRITNGSCEVVSSGCSINFQQMIPEFLNASLSERTRVVVEQSCWFSDIQGEVSDLRTALRIFTLDNSPVYSCDCTPGSFGTSASAMCHFYFKECALTSVRVQRT